MSNLDNKTTRGCCFFFVLTTGINERNILTISDLLRYLFTQASDDKSACFSLHVISIMQRMFYDDLLRSRVIKYPFQMLANEGNRISMVFISDDCKSRQILFEESFGLNLRRHRDCSMLRYHLDYSHQVRRFSVEYVA